MLRFGTLPENVGGDLVENSSSQKAETWFEDIAYLKFGINLISLELDDDNF